MWTPTTRAEHNRDHLRYETDLTDAEWEILEPLLPKPKAVGRPLKWPLCEIVNAIFYVLRGGIGWRLPPSDLPPKSTVFDHFSRWGDEGVFASINHRLVMADRERVGREAIGTMLLKEAPDLSGAIRVFADDVEHFPGKTLPTAKRYVFPSPLPYARKIEGVGRPPQSDQAPEGVFQVAAELANKRFGNIAHIGFGFEAVVKAPAKSTRAERKAEQYSRVPAIVVRPY